MGGVGGGVSGSVSCGGRSSISEQSAHYKP